MESWLLPERRIIPESRYEREQDDGDGGRDG
jgi:hypothetical protein